MSQGETGVSSRMTQVESPYPRLPNEDLNQALSLSKNA
jgi:hypothetical protein